MFISVDASTVCVRVYVSKWENSNPSFQKYVYRNTFYWLLLLLDKLISKWIFQVAICKISCCKHYMYNILCMNVLCLYFHPSNQLIDAAIDPPLFRWWGEDWCCSSAGMRLYKTSLDCTLSHHLLFFPCVLLPWHSMLYYFYLSIYLLTNSMTLTAAVKPDPIMFQGDGWSHTDLSPSLTL